MPTHKSEDYKIGAVKYYLDTNKTQEDICNIFKCSVRSLMRWDFLIYLYETMKCSTENDNLKYFIIEIFNSFGRDKNKIGFNKPILLNKIYTRPDM
jgi:hypothetical protein